MPKRIENLKETILQHARQILLEEGYGALTMRAVAARCGIAVGTVYNYFPAKDMMVGNVIVADWLETLGKMQQACSQAEDLRKGILCLYEELEEFSKVYWGTWTEYTFQGVRQADFAKRHRMLVEQMAACLRPLLQRHHPNAPEKMDVFCVENILLCFNGSPMTITHFLSILAQML